MAVCEEDVRRCQRFVGETTGVVSGERGLAGRGEDWRGESFHLLQAWPVGDRGIGRQTRLINTHRITVDIDRFVSNTETSLLLHAQSTRKDI